MCQDTPCPPLLHPQHPEVDLSKSPSQKWWSKWEPIFPPRSPCPCSSVWPCCAHLPGLSWSPQQASGRHLTWHLDNICSWCAPSTPWSVPWAKSGLMVSGCSVGAWHTSCPLSVCHSAHLYQCLLCACACVSGTGVSTHRISGVLMEHIDTKGGRGAIWNQHQAGRQVW